jgi:hypothetical protein
MKRPRVPRSAPWRAVRFLDRGPGRKNPRAGHRIPIADCVDLVIVPMWFLDAAAEQGCRPARSAQSERPHPRPYGTELRNRELRCEERYGRPEREPSSVPAFHSNPIAEDRVAAGKSCASNGAEAQARSRTRGQDCADVASRNLPLRHRMPCQGRHNPEVGTIAVRSKQLLDQVVVMLVGGVFPCRSCQLHLRQGTALIAAARTLRSGRALGLPARISPDLRQAAERLANGVETRPALIGDVPTRARVRVT